MTRGYRYRQKRTTSMIDAAAPLDRSRLLRWAGLWVLSLCLLPVACAETDTASDPAEVIVLNPADAERKGSIVYKWDLWVVWCGHNICDGSYTWRFPEKGRYTFVWPVGHKCAGSAPYALLINGKEVNRGRIPQLGSCEGCTPRNIRENPDGRYGHKKEIVLGRYKMNKGDRVELRARNSFVCGIENPGAYAAFNELLAKP